MSRLFAKRGAVWLTIIAVLVALSYLARYLMISPIEEDLANLEKERSSVQRQITSARSQINAYNETLYENNVVEDIIPTGYDVEELIQEYVLRSIYVSETEVESFTYSPGLPEALKLGNNVKGTKVNVTVKADTMDEFYDFIDEVYQSKRAVYISSFTLDLPSEDDYNNDQIGPFSISVEYYLFYYEAPVKN